MIDYMAGLSISVGYTCTFEPFFAYVYSLQVLAKISAVVRPAVSLPEVLSEQQLHKLLMLCVGVDYNTSQETWGGPWAGYAVASLLLDILLGSCHYACEMQYFIRRVHRLF